jgi:hypothetical protein
VPYFPTAQLATKGGAGLTRLYFLPLQDCPQLIRVNRKIEKLGGGNHIGRMS